MPTNLSVCSTRNYEKHNEVGFCWPTRASAHLHSTKQCLAEETVRRRASYLAVWTRSVTRMRWLGRFWDSSSGMRHSSQAVCTLGRYSKEKTCFTPATACRKRCPHIDAAPSPAPSPAPLPRDSTSGTRQITRLQPAPTGLRVPQRHHHRCRRSLRARQLAWLAHGRSLQVYAALACDRLQPFRGATLSRLPHVPQPCRPPPHLPIA